MWIHVHYVSEEPARRFPGGPAVLFPPWHSCFPVLDEKPFGLDFSSNVLVTHRFIWHRLEPCLSFRYLACASERAR